MSKDINFFGYIDLDILVKLAAYFVKKEPDETNNIQVSITVFMKGDK